MPKPRSVTGAGTPDPNVVGNANDEWNDESVTSVIGLNLSENLSKRLGTKVFNSIPCQIYILSNLIEVV
jgi:hypothetical protein